MRDRLTGATIGISDGPESNGFGPASHFPFITADGTAVAFSTDASDFVPGDTNGSTDVIVWSPCPLGSRTDGPVSEPIRTEVEPRSGGHSFTAHDVNCNVVAARGL